MGAVCYTPKKARILKEDVLRALNDKRAKESITEPDGVKTLKTDEQQSLITFCNITQQLNLDTYEGSSQKKDLKRSVFMSHPAKNFNQIELKILTYYGHKEDIYQSLALMSRKSLYFMRKNYKKIEQEQQLKHANERIKFIPVRSIDQHKSGVNQMLRLNSKELVTVSDDCTVMFWSAQTLKMESSINTETITCITATGGLKKEILVAGCHSGNLLLISSVGKAQKDQVANAHYNLIRVVVSLEALKHKYFASADVCGIVKVWTASLKPMPLIEIEQAGAISYNSMIEVQNFLPKRDYYQDTALIACALKSQKINLILLLPSSSTYQILKTLKTDLKPTCLIQLSQKHLAVAVGSLKEDSNIEIHDMAKSTIVSSLKLHTDMIDSLLKLDFPPEKTKNTNPYVTWLLSASRDRTIILWKLMDGKIMKRNESLMKASAAGNPAATPMTQTQIKRRSKGRISASIVESDQLQLQQQNQIPENRVEDEDGQFNLMEEVSILQRGNKEGETTQRPKEAEANVMQDYFYSLDTTHKDFIRSMVQLNDTTLLTASEDKSIKVFTIAF